MCSCTTIRRSGPTCSATEAFALFLSGLLAACSSSDDRDAGTTRVRCPIGDLAQPLELEIVHQDRDGNLVRTQPGAEVPLIIPPQGGHVLFIGARARNLDCEIDLTVSLRDECDKSVIAVEQRPATLAIGSDGWGEPAFPAHPTHYGNLPACPQAAASRDIEGEPYLLRLVVEDLDGKKGEASLEIIPTCGAAKREDCLCECDKDFVLGGPCAPDTDSGARPGSCPTRDGGM